MNLIADFRTRLQHINAQALATPLPNLADAMAKTARHLHEAYGDIRKGSQDQQGIRTAVLDYWQTGKLTGYRQTKYVCFGVASDYGIKDSCLLHNTPLFSTLIAHVDNLQAEPRKFRRCYQGLLNAYFHYRISEAKLSGKKNWLHLRDFLARRRPVLAKHKPLVLWVQALVKHRNLLMDEPCKPYAKALLADDWTVVDELKSDLGISDDTWVMDELVLAPIQAAVGLGDDAFKQKLDRLLLLLDKRPLLASDGVALLLKRYHTCRERPEHAGLRDLALREWKSPWLQAYRWQAKVGETITAMVKLWLTKQYIKDFFELLQSDRQADLERMEFWLHYAEAIEDFWLAMGTNSFRNPNKDYQRIREQMAGRLMRLEGNNQNDDNAFMMKIGGYVFIEFGKANNACHVFLANNLPFQPGQAFVSGTTLGLKNTRHPGHCKKLLHAPDWRYKFAEYLVTQAGALPNQSIPSQGRYR